MCMLLGGNLVSFVFGEFMSSGKDIGVNSFKWCTVSCENKRDYSMLDIVTLSKLSMYCMSLSVWLPRFIFMSNDAS